jgi:hypothetical protein
MILFTVFDAGGVEVLRFTLPDGGYVKGEMFVGFGESIKVAAERDEFREVVYVEVVSNEGSDGGSR